MRARPGLLWLLAGASCTSASRPTPDSRISVKATVHASIPEAGAAFLDVVCDSRVKWWRMAPPVRAQVRVSVRWFHAGAELTLAEPSDIVLKAPPVSFTSLEREGEEKDSETFRFVRAAFVKGGKPAPLPDRVQVTARFTGTDSGTPPYGWGDEPEAACVLDLSLVR